MQQPAGGAGYVIGRRAAEGSIAGWSLPAFGWGDVVIHTSSAWPVIDAKRSGINEWHGATR